MKWTETLVKMLLRKFDFPPEETDEEIFDKIMKAEEDIWYHDHEEVKRYIGEFRSDQKQNSLLVPQCDRCD